MKLPQIDFSSLEIREIGAWPAVLRGAVVAVVVVIAMVAVYFLVFETELTALDAAQKQLTDKYAEFKGQYNAAVNIDAYRTQMSDMENAYKEYINELPASSNIPELIDALTKLGEKNDLKINFIKIGDPKLVSGFYMALPLSLNVSGGYHNFGLFISDVAKLSRIVTIGDFSIHGAQGNAPVGAYSLTMDLDAQTYWLATGVEVKTPTPGGKPVKGGAAKPPVSPKTPAPAAPAKGAVPPSNAPSGPAAPVAPGLKGGAGPAEGGG